MVATARNAAPPDIAVALDPDINPWEQQPNETKALYEKFLAYRDSDDRIISNHYDGAGDKVPRRWAWAYRAYQFDLYMARIDEQEMVRYRRMMNARHRQTARAAQGKAIRALQALDPTRLKPSDLVKLLDLAIRIERDAANVDKADRGHPAADDANMPESGTSLHDLLGSNSPAAAEVARTLASLEAAQQ